MNSQILKKISLLLFLTILNSCNKESSEKPNIVLIVADDLERNLQLKRSHCKMLNLTQIAYQY
jgi:hypothetical protein